MSVLSFSLFIVGLTTLIGLLQLPLIVEYLAAAWPKSTARAREKRTAPAEILIPARNESQILPETLQALKTELKPDDRIWLIADNCTDDTAAVARAEGAHVVERHNTDQRGKGFALQHLIDRIDPLPNSVAVILDADCRFEDGALDRIVRLAAATEQPVQARYRMTPASNDPRAELSHFAVLLKNTVRQRGLSRLRLPCVLSGSGMAFPWSILKAANLANDNTADDLQLTCDLALAGHAVRFCDDASVVARLPTNSDVVNTQRKRWIHGHLRTAFHYVPRLFLAGLTKFRFVPIAVALEVAVPPLSVLVLLHILLVTTGTLIGVATADWRAAIAATTSAITLVGAISIAWLCHGRGVFPLKSAAAVPAHVFESLASSVDLLFRRQHWTPTDREIQSASDKGSL